MRARGTINRGITLADLEQLRGHFPSAIAAERKCIHCGCTDSKPCPGGCSWVAVGADIGVCSTCENKIRTRSADGAR